MSDQGALRIEANPRWIRGVHHGSSVVDSRHARFVWEHRYYPQWYFPLGDLTAELRPNGRTFDAPRRGVGVRHDVVLDGEEIADAAWTHPNAPDAELRGLVRFEFGAIQAWFEEDVEVFVHPRSPEVRVDVLPSSRHIEVRVGDALVADSTRSRVLYETGLPARYYLPKWDVRMDLLTATDSESACPYKGWASYWNVTVDGVTHEDLAWGYRAPLPESAGVAGLVCFYNEKVDIVIDGVAEPRPVTKSSASCS